MRFAADNQLLLGVNFNAMKRSGYLNAFKGDFKLEWVLEVAWVVQDYNITYMDLTKEWKNEEESQENPIN